MYMQKGWNEYGEDALVATDFLYLYIFYMYRDVNSLLWRHSQSSRRISNVGRE